MSVKMLHGPEAAEASVSVNSFEEQTGMVESAAWLGLEIAARLKGTSLQA